MAEYVFTNNWFDISASMNWDALIPQIKPTKTLEIGSYEGRSATYLIDKLGSEQPLELHCVDTWEGGVEHGDIKMGDVEARFDGNVAQSIDAAAQRIDVVKHKGLSDVAMCKLLSEGHRSTFDFVYVDGSHQAPDVLGDAYLGFKLLKVGGFMAFDDYVWSERLPYGKDLVRSPKLAIDAFTNIYVRKIEFVRTVVSQIFIQKISE